MSSLQSLHHFRSYLHSLARARLGGRGPLQIDASDLVQETLLDAYRHRGQFNGATNAELAAWLRRILASNFADAVRYGRRKRRDARRQVSLEAMNPGQRGGPATGSEPSVSEQLCLEEELDLLAAALLDLPEPQREAVVLRHLLGCSLAHIAAHLDRSEDAVAGLIYRGRKRLRERLTRTPSLPARKSDP